MSKRLRIVIQSAHKLLEALGGKTWHIVKCKLEKDRDFCLLQRRYSLKVPSLINDTEESQFTLGDIQEWCFLNRLMPLIQLQEGSVTEAATVWNVLHTIPGVNKINLSCVQGCVNKPRPHLAAHFPRWFQLKPPTSKEKKIMKLLKLRSQGQIQILTFTVQNWVVPQQNFRKTSKHRTAFAISAGGSLDTTLGNSPDKTF